MTDTDTFTFAQLSDRAKAHARDLRRDWDVRDDWWDFTYSDFIEIAKRLGVATEEKQIHFSGFCSQGDGACFRGLYTYAPNAVAEVTDWAPIDEELHRIARELTLLQVEVKLQTGETLEAQITTTSGRYSHSHTMDIDASLTGDNYTGYESTWEDTLRQLLRDLADWLYRQLEAEYEYLTSDEHLDEVLADSDLSFDEDGNII
jgi:hypothetical protein